VREALIVNCHGQGRKLFIQDRTGGITVDQPGDLVGTKRMAVAFSGDQFHSSIHSHSCTFSGPNALGKSCAKVTGPCWVAMDRVEGACSWSNSRQRPHGVMY